MEVLAIGAHPDDIEIGAAGMVAAAVARGHSVSFLILTDDANANIRRREAIAAALHLGVSRVVFAEFADAELVANRRSVERLRRLIELEGFIPDLVVTHATSDSHNDHVEANRLVHATFRGKMILHFPVHLSLEPAGFEPRLFVEIDDGTYKKKQESLRLHQSQEARMGRESLTELLLGWGSTAGLAKAEAFEVCIQQGCPEAVQDQVWKLNGSPFHRFWHPLVADTSLRLVYDGHSRPASPDDWAGPDESIGRDTLRTAFNEKWLQRTPLREEPSSSRSPQDFFGSGDHLLLVGGAVSNVAVREVYNRLSIVRFIVEYELPRRAPAFVLDKITGARYEGNYGVFSAMSNPYDVSRMVMFCGGVNGMITRKILEAIAAPRSQDVLFERSLGRKQLEFLVRFTEAGGLEIVHEF